DGIRVFHVTGVQTCALPISPVVEGRGVAGAPGERRVPVDPLHDVGDVQLVPLVEAGDPPAVAGPEPQRAHAVESHAHADVPADDVGDGEGPLDHGPDGVALLHVLPPPGQGAAGPLRRVLPLDLLDLLVGVGLDPHVVVLAPLLRTV